LGDQASTATGADRIENSTTPLLTCATPLLVLLGRLRRVHQAPDPVGLRAHAQSSLLGFQAETRRLALSPDIARNAHYVLCAAMDDAVLNTGWGRNSAWERTPLVTEYYSERFGGERFFDILRTAIDGGPAQIELAELMYQCLALGFMGQYRLSPNGQAELEKTRNRLFQVIAQQRGAAPRDLSPEWRGVDLPHRSISREVPLWAACAISFAVVCLLFVLLSAGLNARADAVTGTAQRLPVGEAPVLQRRVVLRPTPVPIVARGPCTSLRCALQPEINQNLVTVLGTDDYPIIRIQSGGMFASGSAVLQPGLEPLLQRIARVLDREPGAITVVGHTDNQPIGRTGPFPSNYHLSVARARAAGDLIAANLADPRRVHTEGHADMEPVAPNDTPANLDLNRRIEILVRRPR
jgi:type VI secretion system protein ImpK